MTLMSRIVARQDLVGVLPQQRPIRPPIGRFRHQLAYALFIIAVKIRNGFFTRSEAKMFNCRQSNKKHSSMMPRSDLYGCSDIRDIGVKRVPPVRALPLGENGLMAPVTSSDFARDAEVASRDSSLDPAGGDQARKNARTSKFWLFRRLIASFKGAFDFAPEPPLCFYLEGRPFLEEPYYISIPDLGSVCLLNGVTFHIDGDLGRQACIEDRDGLIAAVCAAMSWAGELANLPAITRWRRYRNDDKTLVQSIECRHKLAY